MLAVLYDVHGNLPALDAVLAEAHAAGATRWLLGGDYALFGAWPKETVVRLSELRGATWIRGNGERWANAPAEAPAPVRPAARWCAAQLGDAAVARLAALPAQAVIDGIRCCHGSPLSDVTGLLPEAAPGEAALLSEVHEPLLIAGHTHLPLTRAAAGREDLRLLNPGSVGMPFDGDPRAAFALVDGDGAIQLRRVAYDHHAAAAAVRERLGGSGGDGAAAIADLVARRIEQARIDPV
ncbi:metallophosphoesterase family protein [Conexibacter sp. JD483]|uniref:metallophosphoesterase family protein n=1 Tax=unclassified Conexibacter TaxID=2627773 RepID=UPI0027252ECF|nr:MULTISPECIES: metallophosphoesterase family protein [unclassified Conexibacter]MDO8188915.1 metallophosphoesterase family protein [Conexibacter sp. CPCC 205706]MDO8200270.1 metallophosphoesterase family protein [Conexibacter sp. CPCC 205762]MDR9373038.1 metallophosphoesterase family protein [Conexibacter sp. JD483]